MNWHVVYGGIIHRVPAPELVEGGYIVPPKIEVIEMNQVDKKSLTPYMEGNNVLTAIKETGLKKILVCAKTTKQLTTFCRPTLPIVWHILVIPICISLPRLVLLSMVVKVSREVFFKTLNAWGKDDTKKFVVLHRSILSEGINVSQLEGVIFLRNMDTIEMVQSIGRVLRLGSNKSFGMCIVKPVYSRSAYLLPKHCRNGSILSSSKVKSLTA